MLVQFISKEVKKIDPGLCKRVHLLPAALQHRYSASHNNDNHHNHNHNNHNDHNDHNDNDNVTSHNTTQFTSNVTQHNTTQDNTLAPVLNTTKDKDQTAHRRTTPRLYGYVRQGSI